MKKSALILSLALFTSAVSFANASDHRHRNHEERHRGHHGESHRGESHHRQCTTSEQSTWLPLTEVMMKAETDGYRLRVAKVKRSCYEIILIKGQSRMKKTYDPSNGNLVDSSERSYHD